MIIQQGESVPFGYGLVRVCWERHNAYEVLPIPVCWIKRFYYWTIQKTKLFEWEKALLKKQQKDWKKITQVLEKLDSIYIRVRKNNVPNPYWGSFSLDELIRLGEEKQVIEWIETFINK